jgi:hypothetical protein
VELGVFWLCFILICIFPFTFVPLVVRNGLWIYLVMFLWLSLIYVFASSFELI